MTTVHIITEDKTGGGLEAILRAEAQHQRRGLGRPPLFFPLKRAAVNGNTQLIEQCRKYPLFRFNFKPRIDHVFYVIDARSAWDLTQLEVQAPQPPYAQSLPASRPASGKAWSGSPGHPDGAGVERAQHGLPSPRPGLGA